MSEVIKYGICSICGERIILIETYAGNKHWRHKIKHKATPVENEEAKEYAERLMKVIQ